MGERLLSRRDSTIVARHEVPLEFGHFLVRVPSARRANRKQPRASALGTTRTRKSPLKGRPNGIDYNVYICCYMQWLSPFHI